MLRQGAFGVLDYAVRAAPTVRAALERLVRYNRLVYDAAVFRLVRRGEGLRIEHGMRSPDAHQSRHSAEFTLASMVRLASELTGAAIHPEEIAFRHPRPESPVALVAHETAFGRTPRFLRETNSVVFASIDLQRPILSADPVLARLIERHAEALLAELPVPTASIADRVRRMLMQGLGHADASSLKAVAAGLHMSARSLQRKLGSAGVTFDALLDEVRRELALRYLADPEIAIGEVAYLLGFSEPSPFHRAFKRWTGMTPSASRKAAMHR
jgi:AraC-like DNA-binding protein